MNENFTFGLSQMLSCKNNPISPSLYLSSIVINFFFISWFTMIKLLPIFKFATNRITAASLLSKTFTICTDEVENHKQVEEQPMSNIEPQSDELQPVSNWGCVGASMVGTSHLRSDKPCQDYHAYMELPDGGLCIAVADGAGSAPYSDAGAKIACDTLIRFWSKSFSSDCAYEPSGYQQQIQDGFEQAHQSILESAKADGRKANEYATTLIGVIITPSAVVAGMVGDGMVILQSQDNNYRCFFDLPEREYANQMHSITSKRYKDNLQIATESSSIISVAICTDGILSLSCDLSTNTPFAPFFNSVFQVFEVAQDNIQAKNILEDYLQHPLINELTDDDKTLVMAKRVLAGNANPSEESIGNTD